MSERERSHTALACGKGVEQGEVERSPDFHDTLVASRHEVFAVPAQQQALETREMMVLSFTKILKERRKEKNNKGSYL